MKRFGDLLEAPGAVLDALLQHLAAAIHQVVADMSAPVTRYRNRAELHARLAREIYGDARDGKFVGFRTADEFLNRAVITAAAVEVHARISFCGVIAQNRFGPAQSEKWGFKIGVAELANPVQECRHVNGRSVRRSRLGFCRAVSFRD